MCDSALRFPEILIMENMTKTSARALAFRVVMMNQQEFYGFIRDQGIGMTKLAYRLGEASSPSDLPVLESCQAKARELFRQCDMKRDLQQAGSYAMIGQFFSEAIKFYSALKEAKVGTPVSTAASQFGVDAGVLSHAIHSRL